MNNQSKLYELDFTAMQHGHTIDCRDISDSYCVYSKHGIKNRRN